MVLNAVAAAVLSVAVAVSSLPRCLYYYDGRTDGRQHSATKPSLSAATASGFLSPTVVVVSTFLNLSQSPSTRIARQSLPLAKEGRIQDVRRPRDPKFDYLSHTALDTDLSRNFNSSTTMLIMSLSRYDDYDMLRWRRDRYQSWKQKGSAPPSLIIPFFQGGRE